MKKPLKAPFPYFGGKSLIGPRAWKLFGPVRNYVEPFAGSLAVLLARPTPVHGPETVNDWSAHVSNVWRAIQHDPQALARLCVGPACEVDTEATHNALVQGERDLRTRLGDPAYCDIQAAAWWIKGESEWIGGGWASGDGPWSWTRRKGWVRRTAGTGINRKLPQLSNAGTGINRKLPQLSNAGTGQYAQRVAWLEDWFCGLRDRLCETRIACGDWQRVLNPASTVNHGLTAVFLDPPYDSTEYVYGAGTASISQDVRDWCIANGTNPLLRIILCGRSEEHDALLAHGWHRESWATRKGYSKKKDNDSERLWYNFNCESSANTFFKI